MYYLQLYRGIAYLASNYAIAAAIPVLMCRWDWRKPDTWLPLLGKMLISVVGMEITGALLCSFLSTGDRVPQVGGILLTILFVLLSRNFCLRNRIALAFGYLGYFSVAQAMNLTIGIIADAENFTLQRFLIVLNVLIIFGLTLIYRAIAQRTLSIWWLAVPIAVSGCCCLLFAWFYLQLGLEPTICLTVHILLLIFHTGLFYGVFILNSWIKNRQGEQAQQLIRQADEELLEVMKENLETYHRIRHDTRNQYQVMKTLLDEEEYDKLRDYFKSYAERLEPVFSSFACANRTVTAVVNMEIAKARRADAELVPAVFIPQEMGFPEPDLCSLLMNLLDNAIEYMDKNRQMENRDITLEIRLVCRTLLVTVANPILPDDVQQALSLHTHKEDYILHGYGSKIVASIARSYYGAVDYQVSGGKFKASVMLTEPEK